MMVCCKETKTKKEIYSYTHQFSYNYNVNLLENDYMNEEDLIKNSKFYVTDLIDNIDLNLYYSYEGSNESKINTTYKIIGELQGVYSSDQEEQKIWQKEYILKEEQALNNTTTLVEINENLKLDLKELNDLVKKFEEEMGMTIDAKYIIKVEIVNNANIDGKQENIKYSPQVSIDLGKKVTSISGDNKEETEYITREYTSKTDINIVVLVIDVAILSIAIILISKVITSETKVNIKNEYRQSLNRILKLCEDKIVQISKKPNFDENKIVDVKDFGEIIKVSEELFKPILYWDNKEKEEAWFVVMSNNVQYRYILRK